VTVNDGPVDAATYQRWLPAQEYDTPTRSAGATGGQLVNGEYHGVMSVVFQYPPQLAAYVLNGTPVDAVLAGCRLMLNSAAAILNPQAGLGIAGQSGPQYVTSGAVAFVAVRPIQWQ
jgi:hypothetical protein